jgi:hypothetical protein
MTMVKVYNAGSYGRLNLMVRPAMDEPKEERWFKLETDERGELRRIARQLVVSFEDGAAEVEDELGRYLLERGLVSAEPVPFAQPAVAGKFADAFPTEPRKPSIAVGSTMTADVARSQVTYLGERIRG